MEFSGSSYPQPTPQQNDPLGTIGKLNTIQQQGLSIDKQKLENFNQKYDIVERGLGNLVNQPDLDGDHFIKTYQNFVKAGVMTPEQAAQEMSSVPTRNGSKSEQDYKKRLYKLAETHLLNAQEKKAAIDHYTGQNTTVNNGNQVIPGVQGQLRATGNGMTPGGFQQTAPSIPTQMPPGTAGFDTQGNPTFQGPATTAPQYIPPPSKGGVSSLPIAPANNSPVNAANNQGGAAIAPGPPVQFEEGRKNYNEDVAHATQKLTQAQPAIQAVKLMDPEVIKGLTGTGPLAKKATDILSALKGVGLIDTSINDPVAQRQELVKKLARYLSDNPAGQRSDEAQKLVQKANADPDYHLLPALVNLTRDNVASDRVEAARAMAFATDENGKRIKNPDFSGYQFHRAEFPNKIDQRAFKLDMMSSNERKELQDKIKKESKENQTKFAESYAIAKKLNMY